LIGVVYRDGGDIASAQGQTNGPADQDGVGTSWEAEGPALRALFTQGCHPGASLDGVSELGPASEEHAELDHREEHEGKYREHEGELDQDGSLVAPVPLVEEVGAAHLMSSR
jgi:hypothetical protein